jgi:hypothetical protein
VMPDSLVGVQTSGRKLATSSLASVRASRLSVFAVRVAHHRTEYLHLRCQNWRPACKMADFSEYAPNLAPRTTRPAQTATLTRGRFVEPMPNERIVAVDEFETEDPWAARRDDDYDQARRRKRRNDLLARHEGADGSSVRGPRP